MRTERDHERAAVVEYLRAEAVALMPGAGGAELSFHADQIAAGRHHREPPTVPELGALDDVEGATGL